MKQTRPRPGAKQAVTQAARAVGAVESGWGVRWHAGHFRTALWLTVAAIGFTFAFVLNNGATAQWFLRDGYVATRGTVVKAPYWADALEPQPPGEDAFAGWHIELRVGDYPFTVAVALADFDPDKNYFDQKAAPDANRFAAGSVHPVWFYADNKRKQPETVAFFQSAPALVIGRAAFPRFPSLAEAIENNIETVAVPVVILALAAIYLLFAFVGKRGGDTAGLTPVARMGRAALAMVAAGLVYLISNDHPLAVFEDRYIPAEIEITRAPFSYDRMTYYNGYRTLWRTWQTEAKLVASNAKIFTIDIDGLDPRRTSWASRHSPDVAALQPGARLAVWQSNWHGSGLDHLGSSKPVIQWDTFLSRERWPGKYTWRDFIKDSPVASVAIATALMMALVWLLPLGGRRVAQ